MMTSDAGFDTACHYIQIVFYSQHEVIPVWVKILALCTEQSEGPFIIYGVRVGVTIRILRGGWPFSCVTTSFCRGLSGVCI